MTIIAIVEIIISPMLHTFHFSVCVFDGLFSFLAL